MKAAIYTRVSTPNQVEEGESLELQKEKLSLYAKAQGWEITEIYEDAGLSGGSSNRPAFQKLIKDARQKKFDVVLVYKIDRLSRSILDFHETMKIFQENNISFVSLTQQFDTSLSTGRLMLNILVDFANFEREINVDRAKDSYLNRLYKGFHSGRTPYGYKRVNGNNLEIIPEEAEKVKKIFTLAHEGVSTAKIGKELNLTKEKVKSILDNPVYTGYVAPRKDKYGHRVQDIRKLIKGNHEPIIPIDFYFNVQKIWRKGPKTTKYIGLFQKIVYCPYCKHNLTFAVRKNRNKEYNTYICMQTTLQSKHCGRYIREEILESIALDSVEKLFTMSIPKPETKNIASEISKIDKKIERAVAMLDDENVPVSQIKNKLAELQETKKRLLKSQKPRENIDKHFKNLKELYPYMTREERKRLWSITIDKIRLYKTIAVVEWKDGRKTKHFLANVVMFGGDEGKLYRHT